MEIAEISVDELADELAKGARVIDVREIDEYQSGHVPGAVHVQLGTVPDNVDDKNTRTEYGEQLHV